MVIGTGTIGTLMCEEAASTSVPKTTANTLTAVDWVCSHVGCGSRMRAGVGEAFIFVGSVFRKTRIIGRSGKRRLAWPVPGTRRRFSALARLSQLPHR